MLVLCNWCDGGFANLSKTIATARSIIFYRAPLNGVFAMPALIKAGVAQ
jgi:hypothetical protein